MKQWTKEDLILFYYQELDDNRARQLNDALATSDQLNQEYEELCTLLGAVIDDDVPEPDVNLNQRIMAGIDALKSPAREETAIKKRGWIATAGFATKKIAGLKSRYFSPDRWGGLTGNSFRGPSFATASVAMALLIVGVFYLGRLSVDPIDSPNEKILIVQNDNIPSSIPYAFDEQASRRILLTNVSSHLETGERLLTMVSNSEAGSKADIKSRRQMIDEMIGFNRLYRRAAERSNDRSLVNVLQQMEIVLLELYHTDDGADVEELNDIRSRLDASDLLYKLKVTNKKIDQEIT